MITKAEVIKYWMGENGLRHQHPGTRLFPDAFVKEWLPQWCKGLVCEVGCGAGRFATLFHPGQYRGVDLNPKAIAKARATLPSHVFDVCAFDEPLPPADTYLFATMLLHVPDTYLAATLARCVMPARCVVYESMDKRLRHGVGDGYAWQRDPEQYLKVFERLGLVLVHSEQRKIASYPGHSDILVMDKEEEAL